MVCVFSVPNVISFEIMHKLQIGILRRFKLLFSFNQKKKGLRSIMRQRKLEILGVRNECLWLLISRVRHVSSSSSNWHLLKGSFIKPWSLWRWCVRTKTKIYVLFLCAYTSYCTNSKIRTKQRIWIPLDKIYL